MERREVTARRELIGLCVRAGVANRSAREIRPPGCARSAGLPLAQLTYSAVWSRSRYPRRPRAPQPRGRPNTLSAARLAIGQAQRRRPAPRPPPGQCGGKLARAVIPHSLRIQPEYSRSVRLKRPRPETQDGSSKLTYARPSRLSKVSTRCKPAGNFGGAGTGGKITRSLRVRIMRPQSGKLPESLSASAAACEREQGHLHQPLRGPAPIE
jgi:hypothetical protein